MNGFSQMNTQIDEDQEIVVEDVLSKIPISLQRVELLQRFLSSFNHETDERYRSMKEDVHRLTSLCEKVKTQNSKREAGLKVLGDEFDPEEADISESLEDSEYLEGYLQDRPELLAAYQEQVALLEARHFEDVAEVKKLMSKVLSDLDGVEHSFSIESHVALEKAEATARGQLNCGAEGLYIHTGSPQEFWVSTWVEPPPSRGANLLDMIVCIDISGSMCTALDQVKQVLHALVERTKPRDRLCLIGFNDKARLLAGWTNTTDVGKAHLHSIVDSLEASGGTRFIPALEMIFEQCKLPSPHSMQIVFLSDGASGESDSSVSSYLASALPVQSVSLCTLGFGQRSTAKLMAQLSQVGRGPYLFIENVDDLPGKLGTVWAWAEETVGEGFLAVRGLGGCRILEVEDAHGSVPIDSFDNATLISLGLLMGGQRRTVSMKVSTPSGTPSFKDRINEALADYVFVLSQPTGHLASCRTVRVVDIPSLFIESLTGIPIRIHLAEEFGTFDAQRQRKLVQSVCSYTSIPTSAFVIDSLQAGSVVVDGRIMLPEGSSQHFVESLQLHMVEEWLRQHGFSVNYIVIPGKLTAQRMMQWRTSKMISHVLQLDSHLLGGVQLAMPSPAVSIAPACAQALQHDMKLADQLDHGTCSLEDEDEECSESRRHHMLQLQAAHERCFPADPEKYSSLLAYDTPSLRASAKVMQRGGRPQRGSKSECIFGLDPSTYKDMCQSVVRLRVEDVGFDWITVSFDSQGAEVWDAQDNKFKRVHIVYAVPSICGSELPDALVEVDGEIGQLQATLTGLDHSTCYSVSVATDIQHATATRRPSRSESKPRTPSEVGSRPGSRRSSLRSSLPTRPLKIPDGVKCIPVLVRTCSVHMTWKSIEVVNSGEKLDLEWSGKLLGPHWLVTLTRDVGLENQYSVPGSVDDIPRAKFQSVMDSKCTFNDLVAGIYVVNVKGACSGDKSDVRDHGRGWVCIGGYEPHRVQGLLEERCNTTSLHRFSESALVEEY